MTRAPDNLLQVRRLLLDHLGPHGLGSLEVGIVGDTAHVEQGDSYHLGRVEQRYGGYSGGGESSRDAAGLCEYASGLDVGTFTYGAHNLRTFSRWIVAQCVAGTADARDIREVIYSPDGRIVRRWDRLGKRTSGDSSHLVHTHFSFFRDSTKAGRDQTPLFRRYLTAIGLLEDDMTPAQQWVLHVINYRVEAIKANRATIRIPARPDLGPQYTAVVEANGLAAALGAGGDVDEDAIVAGVLAGLPPERIAEAIPPELARQVADELARRMVS